MKHAKEPSQELAIFIADSVDIRERLGVLNEKLSLMLGEVPSTLDVMQKVAEQQDHLYLLAITSEPLQVPTDVN